MKAGRELSERGFRARFILPVIIAFIAIWAPEAARATQVSVQDTVYFARNSVELSPEGREALRRQADWLRDHPTVTGALEGHTDGWGDREQNLKLGQNRAEAARQFLISLGIGPQRLATVSYGEDRPRARCKTEHCWSQNRRVVTIITGGTENR